MAMTVEERTIRNARIRARYTFRRDAINAAERARRDALKRRLIDFKGGACEHCHRTVEDFGGYVAAFDFHHVNPGAKSFCVSNCYTRKWSALIAELRLCQLLCRSCHAIAETRSRADDTRRRGRPPLHLNGHTGIGDTRLRALYASAFDAELKRMQVGETAWRAQLRLGGLA